MNTTLTCVAPPSGMLGSQPAPPSQSWAIPSNPFSSSNSFETTSTGITYKLSPSDGEILIQAKHRGFLLIVGNKVGDIPKELAFATFLDLTKYLEEFPLMEVEYSELADRI